jgi:ATP-binding cassette subfamily C protein
LKVTENGGASLHRRNSELSRVSLNIVFLTIFSAYRRLILRPERKRLCKGPQSIPEWAASGRFLLSKFNPLRPPESVYPKKHHSPGWPQANLDQARLRPLYGPVKTANIGAEPNQARTVQPKPTVSSDSNINWQRIIGLATPHRKALLRAHLIAIFTAAILVPVPLLMPLMVDEVLLDKPGGIIAMQKSLFPEAWHGPVLFIVSVMALTILLRFSGTLLAVWQTREFTLVSKDITYQLRRDLLNRLQTISMAEYEVLGSGAVASHLVTDIDTIDQFIGNALAKLLVAVLIVIGVAITLLWMHWQLAMFILVMNPVVIFFTTVLGKKVKELKKQENSALELFQQSLTETLDGIQQIRASNRERHYLLRVIDRARGVKTHSANFSWKSDAANRLSFFIFLMGFEVFRAVSMLMVVFSSLSIGQMFAVYAYLWFMMTPVQEILGIQYSYFSANAALQ